MRGFVRYMDDAVWWTEHRMSARAAHEVARGYLADTLHLEVKGAARVGRSSDGLSFCGFRILPDRLLLSRRRKRRYCHLRNDAGARLAARRNRRAGVAGGLRRGACIDGSRRCRRLAARADAAAAA